MNWKFLFFFYAFQFLSLDAHTKQKNRETGGWTRPYGKTAAHIYINRGALNKFRATLFSI